MRITRRTPAAVAALLLTAAVGATPALAADDESGGVVLRRDGSKAVQVVTVPEQSPRADGFDGGDAGIGAGAGVAALLLAALGAHAVRSRHAGRSPLAAPGS